MIRDKRKEANYFDSYISYQINRIEKKEGKLLSCEEDKGKRDRINLSLMIFKMDLLVARFSAGNDRKKLEGALESAINTAIQMPEVDYESMLNILAFSILLDSNYKTKELLAKHEQMVFKDKLLKCFSYYLSIKELTWTGNFFVPKVYDKLAAINTAKDKCAVLLEYLDSWYLDRSETSWHESHKGSNDTYVGYWSFESAALARVFNINEDKLMGNPYYPVL